MEEADCSFQGSDDECFWALAAMSALEYQFPDPAQAPADYLEVATSSFDSIVGRWDETSCDGGLKWQIYPENSYGYNYKNAISNGCAFGLGARLARYTGEQKYADWSVKLYDWTKKVGLITDKFEVFDGTDDKTNCAKVSDETQWTYNNAMFLHGSAYMYDFTSGSKLWKDRVTGFLDHAGLLFFRPFENATDIMYEWACETGESGRHCNLDQQSFKAYLARFMAKTALMAPFTKDTIMKYLTASAVGAAKSCSGGTDGKTCGSKWYTGGWDGTSGVGQQLSALEVTQALLQIKKNMLPAKNNAAKPPKPSTSSASTPKPSSTPSPQPTPQPTPEPTPEVSPEPAPTSAASSSAPSPSPSRIPSSETPAGEIPEAAQSEKPQAIGAPAPALDVPSAVVTTSPVTSTPTTVPSDNSGPQFDETKPSSGSSCAPNVTMTVTVVASSPTSSCTPSVTVTMTVPFEPTAPAASVPLNSTTFSSVSPPASNNTASPTLPEFLGAGSVHTISSSVLAMFVAAAVFAVM
jgi:mannan endo-1,6-alpha-mannosidase